MKMKNHMEVQLVSNPNYPGQIFYVEGPDDIEALQSIKDSLFSSESDEDDEEENYHSRYID